MARTEQGKEMTLTKNEQIKTENTEHKVALKYKYF